MWYERFAIIAVSLHRDFLPSSWQMYYPTWVDVFTFVGAIGLFLTLFLLFIRFFPMVAMSEVKSVLPEFTAFFGVFVMNRLPRLHHPLFDYAPFQRVTDDAFFVVIESLDPRFMEVETAEFLEEIGGREVTLLYEND